MDHRPKCKSYTTIKLLKENTGGNLHAIGSGNDFLDLTPNTGDKRKMNKLDIIEIKNFCPSKDMKKVNRQLTEVEKRFANHASCIKYKELVSRIDKRTLTTQK